MENHGFLHKFVNNLHSFYQRTKHFTPILFFLIVFSAFISANFVYGQDVVSSVRTKLSVEIDGKKTKFLTTQNTIESALVQGGIFLSENDVTEPPRSTLLTGEGIDVKVKKALPVLISDNNQEFLGYSAYDDPAKILEQLEVKTYPEDRVNPELILDPANEGAVGQKIVITRAPVYTIYVDGEKLIVHSWASTVKEVLGDKVSLGLRDIVSPDLDSQVKGGEIHVTRINVVEVEETATIEHSTQYRDDYYVAQGTDKVLNIGSDGSRKNLVRIRYRNGVIESKVVLSSQILKPAVTQVVKRGLMPVSHRDFNMTYWTYMVQAGTKYGISPLDLYKVAVCESHVNPYSKGAYYGMYQYNLGFWSAASSAAGFGGAAWSDARAQIFSTAKYASENGWGKWGCKP